MRALLCRTLGDIKDLRVEELPALSARNGEVRIAVEASGVNFPDILMVEGKYQVKPQLPFIPGLELAGTVLEVGAGVEHLKTGQRVMAFARQGGAHASEIVLPGAILTPIPNDMDRTVAAAFPIAYGTAHFALAQRGHLRPGESLLVLGAAGGVGLAAIEVGKLLGARVIAAASSEQKLAVARDHGADECIDYTKEDLRERVLGLTDGKGVDVVFDPVGGAAFDQCVRAIAWEGRVLVIGFASGTVPSVMTNRILVKNFSVIGVVFGAQSERFPDDTRKRLSWLIEQYQAGHLKPRRPRCFALEQGAAALAELAERRVIGKIVLQV